jgi:hypothetical protein
LIRFRNQFNHEEIINMKKLIIPFLMGFGLLFAGTLLGQEAEYLRLIRDTPPGTTFQQIQQEAESFFQNRDKGRGSGYVQYKRWEYKMQNRLGPNGELVNPNKMNWDAYHRYMGELSSQKTEITNGSWYFLTARDWINGPSGYNPGIGRVNCIAFHPSNASIFYIGMPSGGLWETTNGGTTWAPLADGLPAIGVSGIAIQPNNANIMYILTGDGDGSDTKTIGVLKSTNGGDTWMSTGLSYDVMDSRVGYKLAMHPSNYSILWSVQSDGLWRTTNAGATWTQMKTGSFRDLEFNTGNSAIMYASTSSQFFRSSDSGVTWTEITSGLPTGENRIAIGVTPNNANYVYLLAGPNVGTGAFKGLFRSFDGGLSFGTQSTTPNILGYSNTGNDDASQSSYDLAIAVSRTSTGSMIIGGINTWSSSNFGVSWSLTSMWNTPAGDYTHADIHALEINPLNNYVYCGSDGGIFRTTNFGADWTDLSSDIENTQWYAIAGTPSSTSLIIGGTQDNGSNKYTGSTTFTHMYGADGMDAMIDHSNSAIMYFSTQNGGLRKSTNSGNTSSSIKPSGSTGSWVTPYVMNPSNASIIYGGYSDVYKSTNGGSTWSNTGVDGRGAMAHGTNNTSRVYASNGSTLYMTNDAAATWTTISAGLPSITITGITINPDNSPEVWVTLGGFTDGQKVYRSANAGTTWTNMTGSLPNIVVNCIAFEDNDGSPDDAVYIGTDVGVFYRDATLGDWIPFSNWLPTVPVFDLEIHQANELITAGTYGRGLWRSSTYTACQPVWSLGGEAAAGYSYYQASDSIYSSRTVTQGLGQELIFKAGNQIRLITGFEVSGGSEFKGFLGPCGAGIPDVRVMGSYEGPMEGAVEVTSGLSMDNPETRMLVYPNPFETLTNIEFLVPETVPVSISVMDLTGRTVKVLLDNEVYEPGSYKVSFDGTEHAAGTYLVSLKAGDFSETRKIILAK